MAPCYVDGPYGIEARLKDSCNKNDQRYCCRPQCQCYSSPHSNQKYRTGFVEYLTEPFVLSRVETKSPDG